jgi:hypothetical protein
MKLTHKFAEMTPEKRPQDPHMDGTGLRFETMEHGGEHPDTMPQAIKLIDAQGRSCIYVPMTQNGKVVDSQGFMLNPEVNDEQSPARHVAAPASEGHVASTIRTGHTERTHGRAFPTFGCQLPKSQT